jgi:hypothetical protein
MRKALLLTVAALIAVTTATGAGLPTRLAKADTTQFVASAAGQTKLRLAADGNAIPQPFKAFGFRAITTTAKQAITMKWSLSCVRATTGTNIDRSGVVHGRGAVVVWTPPTMARADSCAVGIIASRPLGSKGRLIATVVGRR